MTDEEVMRLAEQLGIATSYVDGDQVEHRASTRALCGVIDLLQQQAAQDCSGRDDPFDLVVLIRGGRWYRGVSPRFDHPVVLTIELDDGSTFGPRRVAERHHLDRLVPAATLPIGIHRLRWSSATTGAKEREASLLVAPQSLSASSRGRPGLGLFTPAYALWSEAEPMPSYDGLAALGEATVDLGVDTIATLPLYSQGFGHRFASSPYSPLSRFHWNELLVPDRLLGDDGSQHGSRRPDDDVTTDGTRIDWDAITTRRAAQLDAASARLDQFERSRLATFVESRPDVTDFAHYAAGGDELLARRHELGQWLAEQSLAEIVARFEATGQRLALDLPVGARRDSWDCVRWPDLFVEGASIGAPPDDFFAGGQSWNLPPVHPIASRVDGHRMWHELLATACRFAGVLRIDHVMQVYRLWWVPDGHDPDDGAYVYYPADELLAVAAIVAHRTNTVMVGENLGMVPPAVGDLLDDWGLIGMYMERFTMHDWAESTRSATGRRLPVVPPDSWASIRTHDMPALAAEAAEIDFDPYREALAVQLGRPVADDPESLTTGILERLRASQAYEVVVDLDDVLGVEAPHNQPGTGGSANWTRRLDVGADDLAVEPRLRRVLPSPDKGEET